MKWKKSSENLPKVANMVIVFCPELVYHDTGMNKMRGATRERPPGVRLGTYVHQCDFWIIEGVIGSEPKVTYWLPLPNPPQG